MAEDNENLESEGLELGAVAPRSIEDASKLNVSNTKCPTNPDTTFLGKLNRALRSKLGSIGLGAQIGVAATAMIGSMPKGAEADSMVGISNKAICVIHDVPEDQTEHIGEPLDCHFRTSLNNQGQASSYDIGIATNQNIAVSFNNLVEFYQPESNWMNYLGAAQFENRNETKVLGNYTYTSHRWGISRVDVNNPESVETVFEFISAEGIGSAGVASFDVREGVNGEVEVVMLRGYNQQSHIVILQENANGEFVETTDLIPNETQGSSNFTISWADKNGNNFDIFLNSSGTLHYGTITYNGGNVSLDLQLVDNPVSQFQVSDTMLATSSDGIVKVWQKDGMGLVGEYGEQDGIIGLNGSAFDLGYLLNSIISISTVDGQNIINTFNVEPMSSITRVSSNNSNDSSNSIELEYPVHSQTHVGPPQEGTEIFGSPDETSMRIELNPTEEAIDEEVNDPNPWLTLLTEAGSQNEHQVEVNIGEKEVLITAFGTKYTLDIDEIDGQYFLVIEILDDERLGITRIIAQSQEAIEGTANTEIRIPLGTIEQINPDISSDDDDSTPLGNDDDSEAGDDDTVVAVDDDDTGNDDNGGGCSVIDGKTFKAPNPLAAFLLALLAKSRRKRK